MKEKNFQVGEVKVRVKSDGNVFVSIDKVIWGLFVLLNVFGEMFFDFMKEFQYENVVVDMLLVLVDECKVGVFVLDVIVFCIV